MVPLVGLLLAAVLILVLGCTNTSQASAPPSPGSATPLLSDLSLGKADNGKRYEFYKGSTIRISLEGNPTTGYLWGLLPETVNDLVLKPSADYSFSPDSPALTGSGGTFVFDFMAANPGEAKLVFGYRRSWESDPPAETWSITVKVNDVHSAADPER